MMPSPKIRLFVATVPWLFIGFSAAHHWFGLAAVTGLDWPYAHTDAKIYAHMYAVLSLVMVCGFLMGQQTAPPLWLFISAALGASSLWAFTTTTGMITAILAHGLLCLALLMRPGQTPIRELVWFIGLNTLGLSTLIWLL